MIETEIFRLMNPNEFESARMKALKLAALAARGVGGEKDAALIKLESHMQKHGLTIQDLLDAEDVRLRTVELCPCTKADRKHMVGLAVNCLAYVLQRNVSIRSRLVKHSPRLSMLEADAEISEAEADDWKACFEYYRPAFLDARAALRRAARAALDGFLTAHEIFPPADPDAETKPLRPAQLKALIDAARASQGESWTRAHKLTDLPLLTNERRVGQ